MLLSMALNNIYTVIIIINAVCWFSTFRGNLRKSVMDLVVAAECQNVNLIDLTMKKYSCQKKVASGEGEEKHI